MREELYVALYNQLIDICIRLLSSGECMEMNSFTQHLIGLPGKNGTSDL